MDTKSIKKKGTALKQKPNPTRPAGLYARALGERVFEFSEAIFCIIGNLLALPLRLIWNLIVIGGALTLTVMWLGFVFSSVIGVVLLLIFMPHGFLLPMGLLVLVAPLWQKCV